MSGDRQTHPRCGPEGHRLLPQHLYSGGDTAGVHANIEANKRAIDDAAILARFFRHGGGRMPRVRRISRRREASGRRHRPASRTWAQARACSIALEPPASCLCGRPLLSFALSEALDLCEELEGRPRPWLGVCLDVYHIWWDPNLNRDIARAGEADRIFGFHVCDWLVPTKDVLNDRGMMGDGVIDIPSIRPGQEGALSRPYRSRDLYGRNWWKRPIAEILEVCALRLSTAV